MGMNTVTIKQVNQRTSAVFDRVAGGEELVVTRSGRRVARIVPFRPRDALEAMIADGRVRPATAASAEVHGTALNRDLDGFLADERAERPPW
jgi:prevent-host-death family protein